MHAKHLHDAQKERVNDWANVWQTTHQAQWPLCLLGSPAARLLVCSFARLLVCSFARLLVCSRCNQCLQSAHIPVDAFRKMHSSGCIQMDAFRRVYTCMPATKGGWHGELPQQVAQRALPHAGKPAARAAGRSSASLMVVAAAALALLLCCFCAP